MQSKSKIISFISAHCCIAPNRWFLMGWLQNWWNNQKYLQLQYSPTFSMQYYAGVAVKPHPPLSTVGRSGRYIKGKGQQVTMAWPHAMAWGLHSIYAPGGGVFFGEGSETQNGKFQSLHAGPHIWYGVHTPIIIWWCGQVTKILPGQRAIITNLERTNNKLYMPGYAVINAQPQAVQWVDNFVGFGVPNFKFESPYKNSKSNSSPHATATMPCRWGWGFYF